MSASERIEKHLFRLSPLNVLVFLGVWLMTGFSAGTSTLFGPVRWTTDLFRSHGWPETAEDLAVRSIIALLVFVSALIALWLVRVTLRSSRRHVRFGVPALTGFSLLGVINNPANFLLI